MKVKIKEIVPCSCGNKDCGESTVRLEVGGKVYSAFAYGFNHAPGSETDLDVSADFGGTEWNEMFSGNKEKKQTLILPSLRQRSVPDSFPPCPSVPCFTLSRSFERAFGYYHVC